MARARNCSFFDCFSALLVSAALISSCGQVISEESIKALASKNGLEGNFNAIPKNSALSVSFNDTDKQGGKLGGVISISKASNESDVGAYLVYWGSSANSKLELTPFIKLGKKSTNLEHQIPEGTIIPKGATHFLVFTRNTMGEMNTGVSRLIEDLGAPLHAAAGISFTDTNSVGRKLAGTVSLSKASNESDVTHYNLYWGSSATDKVGDSPIVSIAKTGSHLSYELPEDFSWPENATHFLVRTSNEGGEMAAGVSVKIIDLGVPTHSPTSLSFKDVEPLGGRISGTVEIDKADNESDLSHYSLYWGKNENELLVKTPMAVLAKSGTKLSYLIPAGTIIPAGGTHLIVRSKNKDGEAPSGVSVLIEDLGVPFEAATSVSFADNDNRGGRIAGDLVISRATNEENLTQYVVYWGSSASSKLRAEPIKTFSKADASLTYTFPANTTIPQGATHILVRTRNMDGEMATGVSLQIDDVGIPDQAATSISFNDTEPLGGKLAGVINVGKAADEAIITHYHLWWGTSETSKLSTVQTPFAILEKTGKDLSYAIPKAGLMIPATATHILVRTKNMDGEMLSGLSLMIDDLGVPKNPAGGIAFTDTDSAGGKLSGNITITKASIESDLTNYVLYWGQSSTTKLSTMTNPISTLSKTGSNLIHTISAGTAKPVGATHFLVFTKNDDGEMAIAKSVLIIDKGVPTNASTAIAFTDLDLLLTKLQGSITITKAANEADLTHYVLYWGMNASDKISPTATPIVTIAKTGANLTHTLAAGTAIPTGATHFLVRTKNAGGEMATGANLKFTDLGVPTKAAASVAFTDTDKVAGKIGGNIAIGKATNEADLTDYVIYWGSNATTKLSTAATPIATLAKKNANLTHALPAGTVIPAGATHLLVRTKNAVGEMATGVSVAITDFK